MLEFLAELDLVRFVSTGVLRVGLLLAYIFIPPLMVALLTPRSLLEKYGRFGDLDLTKPADVALLWVALNCLVFMLGLIGSVEL